MNRLHAVVTVAAVCVVGAALAARTAAASELVLVTVPFRFFVSGTEMPPGRYEILTTGDEEDALLVRNVSSGRLALTPVIERLAESEGSGANVLFDRVDGKRCLAEVQVSAEDGYIVGIGNGKENPELAAGGN